MTSDMRGDPPISDIIWNQDPPKMEMTKIEVRLFRWTVLTLVVKHWRDR